MVWETMQAPFAAVCIALILAVAVTVNIFRGFRDNNSEHYRRGVDEGRRLTYRRSDEG